MVSTTQAASGGWPTPLNPGCPIRRAFRRMGTTNDDTVRPKNLHPAITPQSRRDGMPHNTRSKK